MDLAVNVFFIPVALWTWMGLASTILAPTAWKARSADVFEAKSVVEASKHWAITFSNVMFGDDCSAQLLHMIDKK